MFTKCNKNYHFKILYFITYIVHEENIRYMPLKNHYMKLLKYFLLHSMIIDILCKYDILCKLCFIINSGMRGIIPERYQCKKD